MDPTDFLNFDPLHETTNYVNKLGYKPSSPKEILRKHLCKILITTCLTFLIRYMCYLHTKIHAILQAHL